MPSVEYRGKVLDYTITHKKRKTLGIYVHPSLEVEVRVPAEVPQQLIAEKVEKRKRWIYRQLQLFERFHPATPDRKYFTGETHKYLGRQYTLKLDPEASICVKLVGKYIMVNGKVDPKKALTEWYSHHAQDYLSKRFEYWQAVLQNDLPVQGQLVIKPLKKTWGLCKGKTITLNSELIKVPRMGIDYVIIHELCHLKVPYHNENFRTLLTNYLPEWKRYKEVLEMSFV